MTSLSVSIRVLTGVLGCSCLLTLTSCARSGKSETAATAAAPPVVAVAQVSRQDLTREETLAAEFRPFQVIDVHAKVAGYLKTIYVDVGDHVKEGQTLALLEVPELTDEMTRAKASRSRSDAEVEHAKEELSRAEAQHQATHVIYDRLQGVSKTNPKLIAQQEIDDAQAKDLSTAASVSAAKAALAAAKQGVEVSQADVDKTQTMNSYTKITAPFAGVVTKRYADTGAMIPAGTSSTSNGLALVELSQNSLLRLVLPVPESVVTKIRLGQSVDVRVKALSRTFTGKVTRFADTVNTGTRTMDTQIDVPNPSLILVPGMYAEAVIEIEKRTGALSVPLEGLDLQGHTATAYVVDSNHKIQVRQVSVGLETPERVEVLTGLSQGELVVTGNRSQLTPGQQVTSKVIDSSAEKKEDK